MIYSAIAPGMALPPTSLWSCGKSEFGQILHSFSSNSGAILLKRLKNLTQIGFPSLRSVKPDRLQAENIQMKTRQWIGSIIPAIFLLLFAANSIAATQKRANVLFIIVDDLRIQYGPYDIDEALTPNLDKLAAEGVAFGRAYSNVPVCGASRASMLTGVRPTATRFVAMFT